MPPESSKKISWCEKQLASKTSNIVLKIRARHNYSITCHGRILLHKDKGLIDGDISEEPCSRSKTWQGKANNTLLGRCTQITERVEHWFNPTQLKRYLCVCAHMHMAHMYTCGFFWCGDTCEYMCVYMAMIQPNLVKKIFWCMYLFGVGVHVGTCVYVVLYLRVQARGQPYVPPLLRQGLLLTWTSPCRLSWLTC